MAAQAWKLYNLAKKKIGNTSLNLAATVFRITLHQSASNFATATLGVYASLTSEVAEANGYSSSGKALTTEAWTVGVSAGQYKFDADDPIWTATGGTIPNIKGAAIWISAAATANRHLLCRASLTSTQFTLALGNTLTLQMNSGGIFTMA
jgi:phage major head subunit gpT-like protein